MDKEKRKKGEQYLRNWAQGILDMENLQVEINRIKKDNDILNSIQIKNKEDIVNIYNKIINEKFLKLKKEFNFSYCAFFNKTQGKYILSHKHFFDEEFSNYTPEINKKDSFNKLKIPIKMQNSTIGYFLFVKKEIFIKQEKEKAKKACLEISYIIKDFEISKIFQKLLRL